MYWDYMYQENVNKYWNRRSKESEARCLHRECPMCNGTGTNKVTGEACIHMISCPCPKCTPRC